ncbi:hypothetical protein P9112_002445 [Eukaryota sp. TZLM1-RC]
MTTQPSVSRGVLTRSMRRKLEQQSPSLQTDTSEPRSPMPSRLKTPKTPKTRVNKVYNSMKPPNENTSPQSSRESPFPGKTSTLNQTSSLSDDSDNSVFSDDSSVSSPSVSSPSATVTATSPSTTITSVPGTPVGFQVETTESLSPISKSKQSQKEVVQSHQAESVQGRSLVTRITLSILLFMFCTNLAIVVLAKTNPNLVLFKNPFLLRHLQFLDHYLDFVHSFSTPYCQKLLLFFQFLFNAVKDTIDSWR